LKRATTQELDFYIKTLQIAVVKLLELIMNFLLGLPVGIAFGYASHRGSL